MEQIVMNECGGLEVEDQVGRREKRRMREEIWERHLKLSAICGVLRKPSTLEPS